MNAEGNDAGLENGSDRGWRDVASYLFGALRNGLAVLAAILAAFALDAWWNEQDEEQRTDDILQAIAVEFAAAGVQLDSIADRNQAMIEHRTRFVRRTAPALPPIPDDSLADVVDFPEEGYQIFDPAFGALTTLISTGGLERIRDSELQSNLGGWMGELDDLEFEERQLEFATQQFFVAMAAEDGLPDPTDPESSSADLARLRRLTASAPYRQANMLLATVIADYQRDIVRLRDRVAAMEELLGR